MENPTKTIDLINKAARQMAPMKHISSKEVRMKERYKKEMLDYSGFYKGYSQKSKDGFEYEFFYDIQDDMDESMDELAKMFITAHGVTIIKG